MTDTDKMRESLVQRLNDCADIDEAEGAAPEVVALMREAANVIGSYSVSAGMADQYKAEAMAARASLGFAADSDEVSPDDLKRAIAAHAAALPPGFVDTVRRYIAHDGAEGSYCYDAGIYLKARDDLRAMLAAAPSIPAQENDHD